MGRSVGGEGSDRGALGVMEGGGGQLSSGWGWGSRGDLELKGGGVREGV